MAIESTNQSTSVETTLAEFVATTTFDDLPDGTGETVRRAFVDTVGVTLAGVAAESGSVLATALDCDGQSRADILDGGTDSVTATAFAAGTAAHALDYDDISWAMDGHPSTVLVPPIIAVASHRPVSGEAAATAYAVGYEVMCAIAEPISPGHYESGWHATATYGTFGATAAVASLLGLDPVETETALNVAASMPAGTKRNFGSMTKPLHAGIASRSGVTAAQVASAGLTSGARAISGDGGFWDLYGESSGDAPALRNDTWVLEETGVHTKRYPCCYFTHSTIAAVRELIEDGTVDETVEHVDVYASGGAADALSYTRPESELEAKFSMQHAVAVALTRDRIGLEAFEPETLTDVCDLYDRIELHRDESLPYAAHETRIEADLGDQTVTETREHPPWVHEHPPTTAELREKFMECATRAVDAGRAEQIYDRLQSLPTSDVTDLLRTTGR